MARDNGKGEHRAFERAELLPRLRDAGHPDAPQILSGKPKIARASERQKRRSGRNLRRVITEQLRACRDGQDIGESATQILEALSQGHSNIAVAAQFGVALAQGPQTLADLTVICALTYGEDTRQMERSEYLRWRKRAIRVLDAISYCGALGLFEHTLANGQMCFALREEI